jgi:hypothetical protein
VRKWVHCETTIAGLNKQICDLRRLRDTYEEEIISTLQRNKYENAILQIAGGRITAVDEKHTQPLTFKSLEEHLHAYFRQKATTVKDETTDILKFIKANRSFESVKRLKKTMNPGGT